MAQHWQKIIPIDHYIVAANGLLLHYDRKVLTFLYQPLIGSNSFSLYMTLWAELEENRLGSNSSTHHHLMNLLGFNSKDIYEARLKLEGIGLLKTYVNTDKGERSFIYELHPPLNPEQFFLDGMLNIYLYRKIGIKHFSRLKRFFSDKQISNEKEYVDVTKAFQDVFISATPGSLQYLQDNSGNLKVEEKKQFIDRHDHRDGQIELKSFDFDLLLSDMNELLVPTKSLTQKVKDVISNLAFLYNIDATQMKTIILNALNKSSEIDIEVLRKGARDKYQDVNHDLLSSLIDYPLPPVNKIQLDEPKTQEEKLIRYLETTSPLRVLMDLSGGVEPSKSELQIIEEVMFKHKLHPGVINVLIQFVMLKTDMKLTKGYVEKIAGDWSRKQLKTVKDAMDLAKKEHRTYLGWNENKNTGMKKKKKQIRKELIPDWFDESYEKAVQVASQGNTAEVEAKKRAIEEKLKVFRK